MTAFFFFIKSRTFFGLICVLTLLLLAACSDRARQNPFDPQNPDTQGKPVGLSVVSLLDTVRLNWQPVGVRDLTGYAVHRKLEAEPDFSVLAEVPANATQWEERSDRFGVLHSYRIVAKVQDLISPPSEEVSITPGPTVTWVADVNDGALIKLTHDGRHELLRTYAFSSPQRVKIDGQRGNVWVLDQLTGNLGHLNQAGRDKQVFESFAEPADLALNPEDGSMWIADTAGKGLRRYDAGGVLLAVNEALPKLAALAWNPFFQELWAVTVSGRELLRVSPQAVLLQRRLLAVVSEDVPLDLEVHAATGTAWLSLRQRVVRLAPDGQFLAGTSYDFRKALRLAVNQQTAEFWAIDESLNFRASRIIKFDAQGNVLLQFDGFDRPQSLAINPYDFSCYVVDTLRRRVVKIPNEGEAQTLVGGLITPLDIDVAVLPY